jgi:hypothetical protein
MAVNIPWSADALSRRECGAMEPAGGRPMRSERSGNRSNACLNHAATPEGRAPATARLRSSFDTSAMRDPETLGPL